VCVVIKKNCLAIFCRTADSKKERPRSVVKQEFALDLDDLERDGDDMDMPALVQCDLEELEEPISLPVTRSVTLHNQSHLLLQETGTLPYQILFFDTSLVLLHNQSHFLSQNKYSLANHKFIRNVSVQNCDLTVVIAGHKLVL
jgi:hypothetical protein